MPWKFTDEDRARLQPLLDQMVRRMNYAVRCVCRYSNCIANRIEILQGYCEYLGEEMREQILRQVDDGEWSARGMHRRSDMSITLEVDADAAYRGEANMLRMSILPTEKLS